jgi:hypothetical protein
MKLTQEIKRIRIAEACGWTFHPLTDRDPSLPGYEEFKATALMCWVRPGGDSWQHEQPPDFFHDINAINAAARALNDKQFHTFTLRLCDLSWERYPRQTYENHADYINRLRVSFAGTAEEQSEAYGRSLSLWPAE